MSEGRLHSDDDIDAHLNGRLIAIDLALTTILTAVCNGNSPQPAEFAESMRQGALESLHRLSFPSDARGEMIRHETAEAVDRMYDSLVRRLLDSGAQA